MRTVEIVYRYGTAATPSRTPPDTAAAARERLEAGNRAFAHILDGGADDAGLTRKIIPVDASDLGVLGTGDLPPAQRPFAAVIGCADARVPVELIFGEGPNDMFVMRVAGNALGPDVSGSLTYALAHLGQSLRLVVVLGHSHCGALSAAVDAYLQPATYLPLVTLHALRAVLDRQMFVVHSAARVLSRLFGDVVVTRPGYRRALIETAIAANAAFTAHTVQQELDQDGFRDQRAVFGVYLLDTREVWAPRAEGGDSVGLADPPVDRDGFVRFGEAAAQSARIRAMLEAG
jgi:carbonic anhydrase